MKKWEKEIAEAETAVERKAKKLEGMGVFLGTKCQEQCKEGQSIQTLFVSEQNSNSVTILVDDLCDTG